jgi:hypothetical protein
MKLLTPKLKWITFLIGLVLLVPTVLILSTKPDKRFLKTSRENFRFLPEKHHLRPIESSTNNGTDVGANIGTKSKEKIRLEKTQSPKKTPPMKSTPKQHHGPLDALAWWDAQASKHNIIYRLAYGSLLGQNRNQRIIPHDTDIDIVVTKEALSILTLLTNNPIETNFLNQQHHLPVQKNSNSDVSKVVVLFRTDTHQNDFTHLPRIDCRGVKVKSHADACAFTGPIARIIHTGSKAHPHFTYVDVFLTKCRYREDLAAKTWHCRASTQDCTYCPSTDIVDDEIMESLVRCKMNDRVETWCPKKRWAEERLQSIYGKSWRIPNSKAVYSNNAD